MFWGFTNKTCDLILKMLKMQKSLIHKSFYQNENGPKNVNQVTHQVERQLI